MHEADLSAEAIQAGLETQALGRRLFYYECVDSTQSVARILARQGADEGTCVVADEQTAGRGRLNRRWLAPRGTCLLFTVLLRPPLEPNRLNGLTMVCGLAVRRAIRELTGLPAQLKWPNDILLSHRKAGGILTEASLQGDKVEFALCGIGLNVNLPAAELPRELQATSVMQELGVRFPRATLLRRILACIESDYTSLCHGAWPLDEWSRSLETIGTQVCLNTGQGQFQGLAESVDAEGALLVRLADGSLRRVLVADIVPICGTAPGDSPPTWRS